MIDITPYQQKLTWLQEWIELKIDNHVKYLVRKGVYENLGYLMAPYDITRADWEFEVYCAYRQQQEANIKYVTN